MLTMYTIFRTCSIFLRVIRAAIVIYCVLTWFRPRHWLFDKLESFVTPFLKPFRRFSVWLSARGSRGLDFSGWFAAIGVTLLERLLWWVYRLML